ncbi:hypothetical protein LDENG_00169800 [Lucifuga dentata]|nr:hypothetical protein LDENG_00169800 [Lucifuga dentata]
MTNNELHIETAAVTMRNTFSVKGGRQRLLHSRWRNTNVFDTNWKKGAHGGAPQIESDKKNFIWLHFSDKGCNTPYEDGFGWDPGCSDMVQERAVSFEYCPWCTSKGLTYALRSYRINFQESITLCTNPQCLFPLVSRPLEDVLANLEPTIGSKRKSTLALEGEELIQPSSKRLNSNGGSSFGQQSDIVTHTSQSANQVDMNIVSNDQHAAAKTDGEKVNGYHRDVDCLFAETTGQELQDNDLILEKKQEKSACSDGLASPTHLASSGNLQSSSEATLTTDREAPVVSPHHGARCISEADNEKLNDVELRQVKSLSEVSSRPFSHSHCTNENVYPNEIHPPSPQRTEQPAKTEQNPRTADVTTRKDAVEVELQREDLTSLTELEQLVPVPPQLFWKNTKNLCWLDSMLVALINCRSLRTSKPKDEPQQASVWQLISGYDEVHAAIQAHQKTGTDGVVMVPNHVLQKAHADLQSLRMLIFKLLQPKLHCKLGQRETPVFALPLLLMMDSWAEPLFQVTFHWELNCSDCKASAKQRVTNCLPTFTNIVPDWSPLHAVHLAPCNVCCKKNERRTMILEGVPPVFALHFVTGLPDNDVRIYSFSFKGKHYSVTSVIQYNAHLKHFVTWIRKSDGSWLEFDDLKHPDCHSHLKLPVPAQDIHVVFWEIEEDKDPCACSPFSTFAESPPSKAEMNHSLTEKDFMADEIMAGTPDRTLLTFQNETDIICALTVSDDSSNVMDPAATAGMDTSIGSMTLLDTFEGLSHGDIVTLTLVELKEDSKVQPLTDSEQTPDLSLTSKNEIKESSTPPDSSSTVTASEMPRGPATELSMTSKSSDPETEDDPSRDPTYVPGSRRGRGRTRGKTTSRQKRKTEPVTEGASSKGSKVIGDKPVGAAGQDEQDSPVTSTNTSPPPTCHTSSMLDQNARWSYLLSRHPLNQVHKSVAKLSSTPTRTPTLIKEAKSPVPNHSTPNPVRRQQISPQVFDKPQLRRDESEALPIKAAEMYGAFGTMKTTSGPPHTQIPSPAPVAHLNAESKAVEPITSSCQRSQMNTTRASNGSLPNPGAQRLPDILAFKKHRSHSSKVPPGLSETAALRYKLMKKLKAKKKKLEKLNQLLGEQGGAGGEPSFRPDSTDLSSPNTVTSSTYDSSTCDEFLSDLLSPATTASSLSPDSTGFLEMLTCRQDGVGHVDYGGIAVGGAPQMITLANGTLTNTDNFLEEFISEAAAQQQTPMEMETLDALEIFF